MNIVFSNEGLNFTTSSSQKGCVKRGASHAQSHDRFGKKKIPGPLGPALQYRRVVFSCFGEGKGLFLLPEAKCGKCTEPNA